MGTAASSKRELLAEILEHVHFINGKVSKAMADISALNAAVDQLVATDASVVAELQRLSAVIEAGGSVSQADLDALTERITNVNNEINAAIAADPQ